MKKSLQLCASALMLIGALESADVLGMNTNLPEGTDEQKQTGIGTVTQAVNPEQSAAKDQEVNRQEQKQEPRIEEEEEEKEDEPAPQEKPQENKTRTPRRALAGAQLQQEEPSRVFAAAQNKMQQLVANEQKYREQNEWLRNKGLELKEKVKSKSTEIAKLKQELSEVNKLLSESRKEKDERNQELDQLKNEIKTQKSANGALNEEKNELLEAKEHLINENNAKSQQIEQLKAENEATRQKNEELNQNNEQLKSENNKLQDENGQKDTQISEMQKRIEAFEQQQQEYLQLQNMVKELVNGLPTVEDKENDDRRQPPSQARQNLEDAVSGEPEKSHNWTELVEQLNEGEAHVLLEENEGENKLSEELTQALENRAQKDRTTREEKRTLGEPSQNGLYDASSMNNAIGLALQELARMKAELEATRATLNQGLNIAGRMNEMSVKSVPDLDEKEFEDSDSGVSEQNGQ